MLTRRRLIAAAHRREPGDVEAARIQSSARAVRRQDCSCVLDAIGGKRGVGTIGRERDIIRVLFKIAAQLREAGFGFILGHIRLVLPMHLRSPVRP